MQSMEQVHFILAQAGTLALTPGAVHVWRFPIHAGSDEPWLLSRREADYAAGFKSTAARLQYVTAQTRMRQILAGYLGVDDPLALPFTRGAYGKPALGLPYQGGLDFNLTHTDGYGLLAVIQAGRVGIDIEHVKPRAGITRVIRRIAVEEELNWWQSLPAEEQTWAFYRLWTIKEAGLKAIGTGMALSPKCVQPELGISRGEVRVTDADLAGVLEFSQHRFGDHPFTLVADSIQPDRLQFLDFQAGAPRN